MNAVIVGSGLGGLSTALRLTQNNFNVTVIEKFHQPGGRLNQLKVDGFTFDIGPSFMSMTYELDELFDYINEKNPLRLEQLNPLYNVFFEGKKEPYRIWKDVDKLQEEFAGIESNLPEKVEGFLSKAGEFFHDTMIKLLSKILITSFIMFFSYQKCLRNIYLTFSNLYGTKCQKLLKAMN